MNIVAFHHERATVGLVVDVKEQHIYSITIRKSKLFSRERVEIEVEGRLCFEVVDITSLSNSLGTTRDTEVMHLLVMQLETLLEQLLNTIETPEILLSDPVPFSNIIRIEMRQYLSNLGLRYVEMSPLTLFKDKAVISTTHD